MFKIKGYLKKFWYLILACICLLFVQAQTELTLPDYMSDIVSVGIQAGGFASPVSDVLTEETYQHLLLFVDQKDQKTVKKDYKKVSKVNQDIIDTFPKAKGKTVYQLKDLSSDEESELEDILMKPMLIITLLDSMDTSSKEYQEKFGQLPPNMSVYDAISFMDESQKSKMFEDMDTRIDTMGESTLKIAAGNGVKAEYKKLGADIDKVQTDYIFKTGLKMLGIALLGTVAAISVAFFATKVGAGVARALRKDVFEKVESFSNEEFNHFSTASLITRSTNDIQQIQGMIQMLFRTVVYAPIMGIGGLIRVITKSSTSMVWIIGFAILCILTIVLVLFIVAMPKFKKLQILIDKINLVAREILTGLPVIRAFHKEDAEEKRFDMANLDLTKVNIFVNRVMSFMMPLLMFIMNGIALMIVWFGSHNIDSGVMQVGDMMAIIQYTMQIVMAFLMLSMISIMLPRAAISANRINEILDTDLSIKDKEETKSFNETKKGLVEFKNVSFRYPDADMEILTDINFTAEPGKTTAIIGSTGSGKSTIVNLIPRFYDVTGGELCVDGVNVKDVTQRDLRNIIGFVPQKGVLFSGTIESNIKFANVNMSDEQMVRAAEIAQATEFIESKPEKYQAPISQGGTNVSGGQKQRLSIARAIASDPEIYIFDDSFSALDYKTDCVLREELAKVTKDKTVIIVAQRINTVLNADQIITLEDGKIVGKGTHEELMENCETYRQIALSQLSEEELSRK